MGDDAMRKFAKVARIGVEAAVGPNAWTTRPAKVADVGGCRTAVYPAWPVSPAQAGTQNLRPCGSCEDLRVWIPAFAGMTEGGARK